jgi:NDP-sugar pyrophosphorylase family protein
MQAVILAAGRGKRLHPITTSRTKAMAPILGVPIIERVMEAMVVNGVQDFILVISSEDTEIEQYFSKKSKINAAVTMVTQEFPLGMGHALTLAVPHISGDFILSSCDNLVDKTVIKNLLSTWEAKKPNAILSILQVDPSDFVRMGIVELDGELITRIVEKPTIADAPSNIGSVPLYIFSPKLIKYLHRINPSVRGELELQDAIQLLIEQDGSVLGFQITGRSDLTTPDDLLAINLEYLAKVQTRSETPLNNIGKGTQIINPIQIESDVRIGSNCMIGPNVVIEKGCLIGDGANLENVVVLRNRTIPQGSIIRNKVVW